MPTYQYACTECGERLEVVQSFSDDPLTECPSCAGRLRKVFSPVGVVFKGSGFYKTDSRSKSGTSSSAAKSDGSDSSTKSDNGSTKSDSGSTSTKTDSTSTSTSTSSGSSSSSSSGTGDGTKVA